MKRKKGACHCEMLQESWDISPLATRAADVRGIWNTPLVRLSTSMPPKPAQIGQYYSEYKTEARMLIIPISDTVDTGFICKYLFLDIRYMRRIHNIRHKILSCRLIDNWFKMVTKVSKSFSVTSVKENATFRS